MPWGIAAGVVGSVAGAAVSGAMSGGGQQGGTGTGNVYTPYNQPGMDTNFNNNYNRYSDILGSWYGITNPLATQSLGDQFNNPYGQSYIGGAKQAQNAYYGAGQNAMTAGAADYGLGGQLAQASANWGLNGTELQQLQQQSADTANSQAYLRGVQNSPYGAALATNAVDQTNLNYAQTQAQTQANLASAATGAYGAGTQQYGAGAGYYGTGSALPWQASNNVSGQQTQALNNFYGTISPYLQGLNQLQGNALQYLGYGNTAQNTASNVAGQQASMIGQGASAGANLGSSIYNSLNGTTTGNGGYNFYSPYSSLNSSNSGSYDYYGTGTDYYTGGLGY